MPEFQGRNTESPMEMDDSRKGKKTENPVEVDDSRMVGRTMLSTWQYGDLRPSFSPCHSSGDQSVFQLDISYNV